MAKVGFIGLGIMGRPMAGHLIDAGHELSLFSRSGPPAELASRGKPCKSAKEVAENADVVILMVPDTPDVEAVLFAKDGVAEGLKPGKIVIDMSSISPVATKDFAKRIAALGCAYLDAPVSGGEVGAKQATLSIMCGGSSETFDKVKPLLEKLGKNIILDRRERRGSDLQGRQSDRRRAHDRGGRRGPGFRLSRRRRSGEGAPSLAGRPCDVAHSRIAWRAHDQAHVRSGLQDRIASKGSQSRALERACARRFAAEHGRRPGALQRLRRARRLEAGSFGDRPRA